MLICIITMVLKVCVAEWELYLDRDITQTLMSVNGDLVQPSVDLSIERPVCIGARSSEEGYDFPCFHYGQLSQPLQYALVAEWRSDIIVGLSLIRNNSLNGIVPIRDPMQIPEGPRAPAVPLKKITKTYADKKRAKEEPAVAASQLDEDEEDKDTGFLTKNWRTILAGIVIYSLVTSFTANSNTQSAD